MTTQPLWELIKVIINRACKGSVTHHYKCAWCHRGNESKCANSACNHSTPTVNQRPPSQLFCFNEPPSFVNDIMLWRAHFNVVTILAQCKSWLTGYKLWHHMPLHNQYVNILFLEKKNKQVHFLIFSLSISMSSCPHAFGILGKFLTKGQVSPRLWDIY